MKSIAEVLRGELERHFDLKEMERLSSEVLGFDSQSLPSTENKAAFARFLVERCMAEEALQGLGDVIRSASDSAAGRPRSSFAAAVNPELQPGTEVDGRRLLKRIGESGFGISYLAENTGDCHEASGRVVLKVLRPEYCRARSAVQRYKIGLRVVRSMRSPHLASIVEVGDLEDSRVWVARQFVDGPTLADRVRRIGCMHISEANRLFRSVLSALEALHQAGVVHSNIKTENVFISRVASSGSGTSTQHGILADGGIGRLLMPTRFDMERGGLLAVLGTQKAIAPELAQGAEPDPRSDIYAMGVLMYETLTGRPPFEADSAIEVIVKHLFSVVEPPSAIAPSGWVSRGVDELVLTALAKDPADRFQSATDFLRALDPYKDPKKRVMFNRTAFYRAVSRLARDPANEELADAVERQARASGAWNQLMDAFMQLIDATTSHEGQLSLLLRLARISENDAQNAEQAEEAYRRILELDPENQVAKRGIKSSKRMAGDAEGLLEILLRDLETESGPQSRAAILREVATIYEEELQEEDSAFVAWLQVLAENPFDGQAELEIERLAGERRDRWNEALAALRGALGNLYAMLFTEDGEEVVADEAQARRVEHAREVQQTAEQALESEQQNLAALEASLQAARTRNEELQRLMRQNQEAATDAQQKADEIIERYEAARRLAQAGDATEEVKREAERLSQELDAKIEAAFDTGTGAQRSTVQAAEVQQKIEALEACWAEAESKVEAAEQMLERAKAAFAAQLDELKRIREHDEVALAERRDRDLKTLVQLYNTCGRWYAKYLGRPDAALRYFSQVFEFDRDNECAYDAIIDLHASSQSWSELAEVLLRRAEGTADPDRARGYRIQAANVMALELNDPDAAMRHYERVVQEDPSHAEARAVLERAMVERGDWPALVELLERAADTSTGGDRRQLLKRIAELCETRLGDAERAQRAYEQVLDIDGSDTFALEALGRLYAAGNHTEALLHNLRARAELASSPKQWIALLKREGSLQEEEFVDDVEAAACFERVIEIDPRDEEANAALARLYRRLDNFEALVGTLERHARATEERERRIGLLLQCVHILMTEVGAPERAMDFCERILAVDDKHAEALELQALLKSTAGDLEDALKAIDRLAEQEPDAHKKAALLTRAGKLLEDSGDKEEAIRRYKQVLDANKNAIEAARALRRIYEQRGDARGVIAVLEREIDIEDGASRKAALLVELGWAYQKRLNDHKRARECFERALKLDADHIEASVGLAEMAWRDGNYWEYVRHFETVAGRVGEFDARQAADLFRRAGKSFDEIGQRDRAKEAYRKACQWAPDDFEIREQLAELVRKMGEPEEAARLFEQLLEDGNGRLSNGDETRLGLALAESLLEANHVSRAIEVLQQLRQRAPENEEALQALTRAYEEEGQWHEVVGLLQLRWENATDKSEVIALRVRAGDVFRDKLHDPKSAAGNYLAALDLDPSNRNALAKMMSVYSDTQEWPQLIEVILRIADMVEDVAQQSKYYETAASILRQELGRYDQAAECYEKSLRGQPRLGSAFDGLVECLTQTRDWERLHDVYRKCIEQVSETASKEELTKLLDAQGELLANRLGRVQEAVECYERAQGLDPGNLERTELLLGLYRRAPERFLDKMTHIYRDVVREDPYAMAPYRALREAFAQAEMRDELWCTCQTLRCLGLADAGEEAFFAKGRLTRLVKAAPPETDAVWQDLVVHPAQDTRLTAIFAALMPAVVGSQSRPLSAFGLNKKKKVNFDQGQGAVGVVLNYIAETTLKPLPDIYDHGDRAGELSFVFTSPPAVGMGRDRISAASMKALAFQAARHLSYLWPGHFMRVMVPTGTALEAWVLAAIQMLSPRFAVPASLRVLVKEYRSDIERWLAAPERAVLISQTQKLLELAPELSMKRWIAAVDMTADRVGFVFANDLQLSTTLIEQQPENAAAIPKKERVGHLLQYSVSDEYFRLRKILGIALGM